MSDAGGGEGGPQKKRRQRRRGGGGGGRGGGAEGGVLEVNIDPSQPNGGKGRDGGGKGRKRGPPRGEGKGNNTRAALPPAPPGEDVEMADEGDLPLPVMAPLKKKTHAGARTSSTTRAHLTGARFDTLVGELSAPTLKSISDGFGYETMTVVQAQALPICLRGKDVVAKAKTGTGKTLAFMIPCVEAASRSFGSRKGASGLVLSPTRELAQQTLEEGRLLCSFHPGPLKLCCLVGGIPIGKDYKQLATNPDIVVGTPGRLNDHLEKTQGFASTLLGKLETLIFDEADQLLDMGFRPAIEKLLKALGPKATQTNRQTLLFSATLPADVSGIAKLAMRSADYEFIDTVGQVDEQTHSHVDQSVIVCTDKKQHAAEVLARVAEEVAKDPTGHKVVVFFTTARLTQLFAELAIQLQKDQSGDPFASALNSTQVLEIHSRKSQTHRTRVSEAFRESEGGSTLFTSDVSARGMDYPDVTKVIQVGLPSDKAQYVHRLGRTARAGKEGSGLLLLCDFESFFLKDREVALLPIQKVQPFVPADADLPKLDAAAGRLSDTTVGAAYQSWLGYYNSSLRKMRWDQSTLVEEANDWALKVACQPIPPTLQAKTVGMMGLRGVPGLNVEKGGGGGGGKGGKGGGGRGGGKGGGGGRGRGGKGKGGQ